MDRLSCQSLLLIALAAPALLVSEVPRSEAAPKADLLLVSAEADGNARSLAEHLSAVNRFNVVAESAASIGPGTDLDPYALIVVDRSGADLPAAGAARLSGSGKPILLIESDRFASARALGMTDTDGAGRIDTGAVDSVVEELTEIRRYLGREIAVYGTEGPVIGVARQALAAEVEPLVYGAREANEIAVFIDPGRRIAASGIAAPERYAEEGWRLFDLLVGALLALDRGTIDPAASAQALEDSGLLAYIDQVKANSASYPVEEVRRAVWARLAGWDLFSFAEQLDARLSPTYPNAILAPYAEPPYPHHPRCGHPDDLWFLGESWYDDPGSGSAVAQCTRIYFPDCPDCGVRAVDYDHPKAAARTYTDWPDAVKKLDEAWGDLGGNRVGDYYGRGFGAVSRLVRGSDLGISVGFAGRRLFYMGDSWSWCYDVYPGDGVAECPPAELGNDAIGFSTDTDPSDGLDLTLYGKRAGNNVWYAWWNDHFSGQLEAAAFVGVEIPGVDPEPHFSTPCGAAVFPVPYRVERRLPGGRASEVSVPIDTVIVWFTTASAPLRLWGAYDQCAAVRADEESGRTAGDIASMKADCDAWETRKTPTSWVGCSFDGIHFWNCYQTPGGPAAFSRDGFRWRSAEDCYRRAEPIYSADLVARFTQADPVPVDGAAFSAMCAESGYARQSPLCEFFDGPDDRGGLLVFGTGRPAGRSPLFLAYIEAEEFGAVHGESGGAGLAGRPIAHYFDGRGWSLHEKDAAPLPRDIWQDQGMPCDEPSEYTATPADLVDQALAQGAIPEPLSGLIPRSEIGPSRCLDEGIYFAPEDCTFNPWTAAGRSRRAGSFSVKSVRLVGAGEGSGIPQILVLYNTEGTVDWFGKAVPTSTIAYRTAPLSEPWNLSPAADVNRLYGNDAEGYGAEIIDDLTQYSEPAPWSDKGRLDVWHTISSWKGIPPPAGIPYAPYGIYTRKTAIPWPPDWPAETGEAAP